MSTHPIRWTEATINFLRENVRQTDKRIAESLTRITGVTYTKDIVRAARHRFTSVRKRGGRGSAVFKDVKGEKSNGETQTEN